MEIKVIRKEFTEKSTIGEMFINGEYLCYTLEDRVRDGEKVPGETAIPYGKYDVVINFSNRFQKYMPLLMNVPNFSGIRIHPGNRDTDTEGCLLLGFVRGKDFIGQSKQAFNKFMSIITPIYRKEKIFITICKEDV